MPLIHVIVLSALLWGAPEAQQASHPNPAPKQSTHAPSTPEVGAIVAGVYRNSHFGITYKIPFGWVDRTQNMQPGKEAGNGLVLLAIFERPPEAQGETINSAVVIAAEPAASYPGLRSAADYFAPLTELATGKGFKVVNEPYKFSVGGKSIVRSDFAKAIGQQTMRQASLAELEKGYFVSFTFLGGSDDELDELTDRLSLATSSASDKAKP